MLQVNLILNRLTLLIFEGGKELSARNGLRRLVFTNSYLLAGFQTAMTFVYIELSTNKDRFVANCLPYTNMYRQQVKGVSKIQTHTHVNK